MVEYGADLHTMDHGSGFPTLTSKHLRLDNFCLFIKVFFYYSSSVPFSQSSGFGEKTFKETLIWIPNVLAFMIFLNFMTTVFSLHQ